MSPSGEFFKPDEEELEEEREYVHVTEMRWGSSEEIIFGSRSYEQSNTPMLATRFVLP